MWETLSEGAKWLFTPQVFMVLGALLTIFLGWKTAKLTKSGIVNTFLLVKKIGFVGALSAFLLVGGLGVGGAGIGELASWENNQQGFTNEQLIEMDRHENIKAIMDYTRERDGVITNDQLAQLLQSLDTTQVASLVNYVGVSEPDTANKDRLPLSVPWMMIFGSVGLVICGLVTYTANKQPN